MKPNDGLKLAGPQMLDLCHVLFQQLSERDCLKDADIKKCRPLSLEYISSRIKLKELDILGAGLLSQYIPVFCT